MSAKASTEVKKKKKPIKMLLGIREKLKSSVRLDESESHEHATAIYHAALRLRADVDNWQAFCEHNDWKGESFKPQPTDQSRENALRFAVKFAVGFGTASNGNWVRKLHGLLRNAWEKKLKSDKIHEHVQEILADKRAKAANDRATRRANAPRSITLVPSEFSKLLLESDTKHTLKAKIEFVVSGDRKPILKIAAISKKHLERLRSVKTEKKKPPK